MSNSSLVDLTILSPNHSGKRTKPIDIITPHCAVGQLSAQSLGNCFVSPSKKSSCTYGIGTEGKVVLCVDEKNRPWTSSSSANDNRAVTIECASDKTAPYAFNSKVYNKLIDLCVDVCRRNGKTKLLWLKTKEKTLSYTPKSDEMLLTAHRWYKNKSCPGDWMYSRMGNLAKEVTSRLGKDTTKVETPKKDSSAAKKQLKKGDVIKLKKGATYYDGRKIPSWVFNSTLYYRGKTSKGAAFSTKKTGDVTGVVKEDSIL